MATGGSVSSDSEELNQGGEDDDGKVEREVKGENGQLVPLVLSGDKYGDEDCNPINNSQLVTGFTPKGSKELVKYHSVNTPGSSPVEHLARILSGTNSAECTGADILLTTFLHWWQNFVDRLPHYVPIVSESTRDLISCILKERYERLFKLLFERFDKEDCRETITLDLGSGHFQVVPVFNVQLLEGGEGLVQLVLEGTILGDNAHTNLEKLREKFPGMPYPLYLLYKAKLASASGKRSDCESVYKECEALLHKGEYAPRKYCAWLHEAAGLTIWRVNTYIRSWNLKIDHHTRAYEYQKQCTAGDEVELALQMMELARTKHSVGFAYAGLATHGNFPTSKKMRYYYLAREHHGDAIYEGRKLLAAVGMERGLANPSNFMLLMRFGGMLRTLRIKQAEMHGTDCDEEQRALSIQQQVQLVEGERTQIREILQSPHSDVSKVLMEKIDSQFIVLVKDVKEGEIKFFTLDISE